MGSTYLVRHGQTLFGADDYDVLSPIGIRQVEILGDHLLNLGVCLDRALGDGLRHQQRTARTALERLESSGLATPELEVDPAFNEFKADVVIHARLPGLLGEQSEALHILRHVAEYRAELQHLLSTIVTRWVSGNHEKDGLESWQEFLGKVHDGLCYPLTQASGKDRVAAFTSGGTITALLRLIVGAPPFRVFELNWQVVNTSLTRLRFRGEEVPLVSFNSHVYLELPKAPELITHR